jgi:serine/threonine protein kinase
VFSRIFHRQDSLAELPARGGEEPMTESRRCPRCQGELSADAPEGLCPECLFRQALSGPGAAPTGEEASRSPAPFFVPPGPAELAPHFPQFEMLSLLGQGGMGAVYQARQPKLDRLVAVKILPPEVAHGPGFTERFSREARSLARLSHPNIITIFDFGAADGLYYFSMEYVDGKNVRDLLEAGRLDPQLALKIVAQVCDALQYAHDEGFVHRDIKPENILLDGKGRVKIADFGLARLVGLTPTYLTLTGSQEVMGTLYYMAPEQLKRTHEVDHRADLYSLGVVFYEMLTGELPLGRFAPPSQRASVDPRLDAIVLRALAREPEHRYQDAAQIKQEVEAILADRTTPPASLPVPAAQSVSPYVRFTIPMISWAGAYVEGEIFRYGTTLFLDFNVVSSVGTRKPQEVRIPLAEILTISCRTGTVPGVLRWMGVSAKTEIVLKVHHPDVLARLPGRQLRVHRADREAAQQLVDGILRSPLLAPAGEGSGQTEPVADPDRVRMRLVAPAVSLLLTALGAAVSMVLAVPFALELDRMDKVISKHLVVGVAVLLVSAGFGVMLAGAVQMMRGRWYPLCVAAALLAVLPWSPAWLLGLPAGIWALVVLGRPEVMTTFLHNRRGAPAPPGPVAAKIRSWLRSFAGYFVTVSPGSPIKERRAKGQIPNDE